MSMFEEGIKLMNDIFGNGKDNLIAVATIARVPAENGKPRPVVRCVDALYEDGAFYVTTNAKSNKMLQIAQNSEISVAAFQDMFNANAQGENLGWVLAPENADLRVKLRKAFSAWYDMANNENDENCCILKISLTKGVLNINHWEKLYFMDFENKADMENSGVF